jgi:hypothetical protein
MPVQAFKRRQLIQVIDERSRMIDLPKTPSLPMPVISVKSVSFQARPPLEDYPPKRSLD